MSSPEHVNWQPISQMPLVASMIDGALSDTAEHIQTLAKARTRPHVLDDATIDRVERVHGEQLEFVESMPRSSSVCETKIRPPHNGRSWTACKSRAVACVRSAEVLVLAAELRKGTINRIYGHERSRTRPAGSPRRPAATSSLTRPSTLRAIRYRALLRRWAF